MSSPATITVRAAKGALLAEYHPAAVLSACHVQRSDVTLNNQLASFSAHITEANAFWANRSTRLSLTMSPSVSWEWPLQWVVISGDRVDGVVVGDPEVVRR
jgi:hypothetical protein